MQISCRERAFQTFQENQAESGTRLHRRPSLRFFGEDGMDGHWLRFRGQQEFFQWTVGLTLKIKLSFQTLNTHGSVCRKLQETD